MSFSIFDPDFNNNLSDLNNMTLNLTMNSEMIRDSLKVNPKDEKYNYIDKETRMLQKMQNLDKKYIELSNLIGDYSEK